jgi:hypothetical protein
MHSHPHNHSLPPSRPLTANEQRHLERVYGAQLAGRKLLTNTAVKTTIAYHTNTAALRDPTRTTKLRQRYVKELRGRFLKLKRLITTTLVDNDALRLAQRPVANAVAQRAFKFTNDAERVAEFNAWLQEAIDQEILEVVGNTPGAPVNGWQKAYVREAYGRGLEAADAVMAQQGITLPIQPGISGMFRLPVHQDTIELLYTRQFEDLRGITRAMSSQISRELADGLATGKNNSQIAKAINNSVDKIGIVRSEILARTEIIRVHAESTLNGLEALGATVVTPLVEFATAADPCKLCEDLAGKVFTIAEARGIIPKHPLCRCAWLPVLQGI